METANQKPLSYVYRLWKGNSKVTVTGRRECNALLHLGYRVTRVWLYSAWVKRPEFSLQSTIARSQAMSRLYKHFYRKHHKEQLQLARERARFEAWLLTPNDQDEILKRRA
jgi:hypothetical protein